MKTTSSWVRFKKTITRRMVSGMLVLVPVGVTLLVMRLKRPMTHRSGDVAESL